LKILGFSWLISWKKNFLYQKIKIAPRIFLKKKAKSTGRFFFAQYKENIKNNISRTCISWIRQQEAIFWVPVCYWKNNYSRKNHKKFNIYNWKTKIQPENFPFLKRKFQSHGFEKENKENYL
jgi:hypothetical protein